MLGLGLSITQAALRAGVSAPVAPAITNANVAGDSITFADGSFGRQYAAAPPSGVTVNVRAQNSRVVGTTANLNDGGNSLFGHVQEDVTTYGGQLITTMIGANDLPVVTEDDYRNQLIALNAAYKAAGNQKFAWSPPLPYNPTGTPHPSKATFDGRRAAILSTCRNPAVWSQWCDYYMPLGEYPDFADATIAAPLFGDTVHPSATGQNLLATAYKRAMDTILDPGRATSTTMFNAAWPTNQTSLPLSTEVTARIIVSGIAHTGTALGASVSGGGAQIRRGGGAWGTSTGTGSGNGYRLYNCDVLDVKCTTSASPDTPVSFDLTIGSETRTITLRTSAEVPAAQWVDGQALNFFGSPQTTHSQSVAFPEVGVGLIFVCGDYIDSVTYDDVACPMVIAKGDAFPPVYVFQTTVADTDPHVLVINYPGGVRRTYAYIGTVANADPTAVATYQPSQNPNNIPVWTIAGVTVPDKGIALCALGMLTDGNNHGASVTTGTLVHKGFGTVDNGEDRGLLIARRTDSGSFVFNFNDYRNQSMVAAVFKAAGS